jgi:hypothetical protein
MAGRSCLLRYSWFGENSNVFERRVVLKEDAPTKPSADGWWGRGAPSGVETPLADYFTTGEVLSVNWKIHLRDERPRETGGRVKVDLINLVSLVSPILHLFSSHFSFNIILRQLHRLCPL